MPESSALKGGALKYQNRSWVSMRKGSKISEYPFFVLQSPVYVGSGDSKMRTKEAGLFSS
jgi:hypothetical protein